VAIAPMIIDPDGGWKSAYARSVSPREWISLVYVLGSPTEGTARYARVVLPPDAGPDAGPLPVPGCPLGEASPECEDAGGVPMQVGESDWYFGSTVVDVTSFRVSFPAVFGPDGEVSVLFCCDRSVPVNDILPLPGARFLGRLEDVDPTHPDAGFLRPILWRKPQPPFELLPLGEFTRGARAYGGDAAGRIVGQAVDPPLPLVWVPAGEDFEIVVLPLLGGDRRGIAYGISGGRVVGASADHAVVWEPSGSGWDGPQVLPTPEEATACTAQAIDGPRVVGNCELPNGDRRAVSWHAHGDGWYLEARLLPVPEVSQSFVRSLSGDLAVGHSINQGGFLTPGAPVAWRLP